ncbi:MAG: hypothetical protein KHX03_00815 [Clostridium sp.]|nr:hypothetical protein [Clostridium sp.]
MKIKATNNISNKSHVFSKQESLSFKASTFLYKEGVDAFIKASKAEPEKVIKMFENIVEHFKSVKSENILFKVQQYPKSKVNITAEIVPSEARMVLAKKYKDSLTAMEYEKISNFDLYMEYDLKKPLLLFQKKSPRAYKDFDLYYGDDAGILDEIKKRFPVDCEKDIFLGFVRRKPSLGVRFFRWLDNHGPDEPPIY